MNPNVCWTEICRAFAKLNLNPDDQDARERAADCLLVLRQWIQRGGFPPVMEEAWNNRS